MFCLFFLFVITIFNRLLGSKRDSSNRTKAYKTLQLQYAAYHAQKPMDSVNRLVGVVKLYKAIQQTKDLVVTNPILQEVSQVPPPYLFSFKSGIEAALLGIDMQLIPKSSSGFKMITLVDDINVDSVVFLVEAWKRKNGEFPVTVFAMESLSRINHEYLQSRLRREITKLPNIKGLNTGNAGPLAVLLSKCEQCLYLSPESFLFDLKAVMDKKATVFFKAPSPRNKSEPVFFKDLRKHHPAIRTDNFIFSSVYIHDKTEARLSLMLAHAMLMKNLYDWRSSNVWWVARELVGLEYKVIGVPVLAGKVNTFGGKEMCGILGSMGEAKNTLIYAEHAITHLRFEKDLKVAMRLAETPELACQPISGAELLDLQ